MRFYCEYIEKGFSYEQACLLANFVHNEGKFIYENEFTRQWQQNGITLTLDDQDDYPRSYITIEAGQEKTAVIAINWYYRVALLTLPVVPDWQEEFNQLIQPLIEQEKRAEEKDIDCRVNLDLL